MRFSYFFYFMCSLLLFIYLFLFITLLFRVYSSITPFYFNLFCCCCCSYVRPFFLARALKKWLDSTFSLTRLSLEVIIHSSLEVRLFFTCIWVHGVLMVFWMWCFCVFRCCTLFCSASWSHLQFYPSSCHWFCTRKKLVLPQFEGNVGSKRIYARI